MLAHEQLRSVGYVASTVTVRAVFLHSRQRGCLNVLFEGIVWWHYFTVAVSLGLSILIAGLLLIARMLFCLLWTGVIWIVQQLTRRQNWAYHGQLRIFLILINRKTAVLFLNMVIFTFLYRLFRVENWCSDSLAHVNLEWVFIEDMCIHFEITDTFLVKWIVTRFLNLIWAVLITYS